MLWQDLVITAANIALSLALVPQIVNGFVEKRGPIKLATSIPTFLGLFVVAAMYFTLSLYLSAIVCAVASTMWLVLLIQRLVYKS